MSDDHKTSRDFWSIVDLIGKLASSILISGVLGYFIQQGAQEISYSIETGKLTQSLISDLAAKKEDQLRQDLALAALDGSVGERKRELVASVAERIYRSKSGFNDPTAKYALEILSSRNAQRYEEIKQEKRDIVLDQPVKSQPNSQPNLSPPPVKKSIEQVQAVSQVIARTFTGVVFIQFKNNLNNVSQKIKNELVKQGLEVPPLEQVNTNYSNSIRYFNKEDADLAVQAKLLAENASGQKFEILNFSKSGYKIPKGQIEVWIGS